ncbi:MAG TPA: CoA-binding protein [Chloroflexota bacterium]|jgi:predicted CoA-binding protein|nr:CoA-binding protein [Chloroflexota bacterium]
MPLSWQDDDCEQILHESKTIAVVGLSNDHFRPSYGVARYLQQEGYRIIPVNPHEHEVLGQTAYPDLASVPERVDVVDVFRNARYAAEIVQQAEHIGAKVVWLQPGAGTLAAATDARAAGLKVVLNRCMATELERLHELAGE